MQGIKWFRRSAGTAPFVVGVAVLLVWTGCSSDTTPMTVPSEAVDSGVSLEKATADMADMAQSSAIGVTSGSLTRYIEAGRGGEMVLGAFKVRIEPGGLSKSLSVTLTVVDAARNRFRVGPAGTKLLKPMRVSLRTSGMSGSGSGALRFFYRGNTPPWVPLATTRTTAEVAALHGWFGEFAVGSSAPAGSGTAYAAPSAH